MSMKRLCLAVLVWITCFGTSYSQAQTDFSARYQEGISLFKKGNYVDAKRAFGPITGSVDLRYGPGAHFYYALAEYHLKRYNESVNMLRQMQARFPEWNKDEVNYLYGANNLAAGHYAKGFEFLQRINVRSFDADIMGVKQQYLADVKTIDPLKSLQKQFPNDRVVAESFVNFTRTHNVQPADRELAVILAKRFDIPAASGSSSDATSTVSVEKANRDNKEKTIHVAVLMPFRLDEFSSARRSRSNQFAYDYYLGMQNAVGVLQNEKIQIVLEAYDVNTEDDLIRKLVYNSAFQKADVLVGPLYPKPLETAVKYSDTNGILTINPMSTDQTLLENNKSMFIMHPTLPTLMKQVASLARDLSAKPTSVIYYGSTAKDSMMVATYETELIKKGGKILKKEKIANLADTSGGRINPLGTLRPAHIALFSSDTKSGESVMASLNRQKLTGIPVIATSTSFDFQRSRPKSYGKRLYLIESDNVDINKKSYINFQTRYYDATSTLPSVYSCLGFDHLLFLGRMLSRFKDDPLTGITLRNYESEDYILSGFNFTASRDNNQNAILKFEDGHWVQY